MDRGEQIKELEKSVVKAAIALYERDCYDDLYELIGDVDRAADRFLYFKEYGMSREDRERIQKEQAEAEKRSRLEYEVNAITSHPDFKNLTSQTIEKYIGELKRYQHHGDTMMAEAIAEAFKRCGVEVFETTTVKTEWKRIEESDRNG